MSRKLIVNGFKLFDAQSLAASVDSTIVSVKNLDKAAIFVEWTGTAINGVIEVQVRIGDKGTWFSLDFGSAINITGSSGNHFIYLNELPFTDVKLKYTRTAGSGSMTASIAAKTVGS
jgi:hypothetical protein